MGATFYFKGLRVLLKPPSCEDVLKELRERLKDVDMILSMFVKALKKNQSCTFYEKTCKSSFCVFSLWVSLKIPFGNSQWG
jgi:hypothetical protein